MSFVKAIDRLSASARAVLHEAGGNAERAAQDALLLARFRPERAEAYRSVHAELVAYAKEGA